MEPILLCSNSVTPSKFKVIENDIEFNGTFLHKHGRYDRILLKSLCVMSNIKVFATQDGHPPVVQTPLIT